jgi:membrane-associated phospholipid phosphatase
VFGIAWLLLIELGGAWLWTLLVAFLVAISRVYVGVHYPSDVAGGALLGLIVAWLVHRGLAALQATTENARGRRRARG